ncbi:MAG TPA: hypothetical protein VFR37_19435 [Longimicrobium sp.]|nr:hypothetical protein [Longimicrobium sp.]
MKKLTLKLDDLEVDTFTTAEQSGGKGTVQGHYGTTHTQEGHTCNFSCDYTCAGYATSPGPEYPCNFCGG